MFYNQSKIINLMLMVSICCLSIACKPNPNNPSASQLQMVKDSVGIMAEKIAQNISANGPAEWLKAFENSPDFYMANDGQIEFANYDSAVHFINTVLKKHIKSIQLKWSSERIEPLTQNLANFAANYQENIIDSAGKTTSYIGYFTSIAKLTTQGWKLHNVHWSSLLLNK